MIMIAGQNIVVYDLEIKLPIGLGGITWNDHHRMGISVGALYDYMTGDYSVYFEGDYHRLVKRLNSADLVVAFNHIGFDNKLLRASGYELKADTQLPNYDMLHESRLACGLVDKFVPGFKLDDHLVANFGRHYMKTSHGEEAPYMYLRGAWGELASYCIADVRREKSLFEIAWGKGEYHCGTHGMKALRKPQDILSLMKLS